MPENKCPRCREIVPKGVYVCPGCAIDIREWNPDKLRCPVCRELYPKGTKYCLKDGSPLEEAVVNFDTEATMFLTGSPKLAEKKDDLIPGLRFAEDRERIIPKLERDEKGHLAPPLSSKSADAESDVVMPDISFEFHTPPEEAPPPPAQPATKKIYSAYDPERQRDVAPPAPEPAEKQEILSPPPKPKPSYKIKPLEEYEQLLKEEEEREAKAKPARPAPMPKPAAAKPEPREAPPNRGFFQRLMDALKILLNK